MLITNIVLASFLAGHGDHRPLAADVDPQRTEDGLGPSLPKYKITRIARSAAQIIFNYVLVFPGGRSRQRISRVSLVNGAVQHLYL